MEHSPEISQRLVRRLQWIWLGGAFLLVGGIIVWIIHLIVASCAWTMSFKRLSEYRSSPYRFFWYLSPWFFMSFGAWRCMGGSVKISRSS